MCKQIWEYVNLRFQEIPIAIYEGMLSILFLGIVIFFIWKGWGKGSKYSVTLMLVEYVFLFFCSTVLYRTSSDIRRYDFTPFWSYNKPELLIENIMNVIAFIPVGALLGSAFLNLKWREVMLISCGISIFILLCG